MKIVICIYLAMLSVWDCKERQVPVWWLAAGAAILTTMGIGRCIQGKMQWPEAMLGMAPGILLLLTAWLTEKAGYADGIVLTAMGLCLGYREGAVLLCFSLLLLSAASVLLLFLRKVRRNTRMPYLPFLTAVYLMRQLSFLI